MNEKTTQNERVCPQNIFIFLWAEFLGPFLLNLLPTMSVFIIYGKKSDQKNHIFSLKYLPTVDIFIIHG